MRKFVTAGAAATALAVSLGLAAPASAATGHEVRTGGTLRSAATASAAAGTFMRVGKVHQYTVPPVRGAQVWGHWYWARKGTGKPFVFIVAKIKDTRGDGKSAGFCYDLVIKSENVAIDDMCLVNTKGDGKTLRIADAFPDWKNTEFRLRAAVGKLKKDTFYVSAQGKWRKLP
ncbi:hypothetical protein [Actinomadura parmotrematis]|uniref:Lipoprotein n=1 Tax=Actinomadura parmotrematis TaxID=2864039 RepID=A0ABS7FNR0_9ACTN|nr:hypothetical protein [Actinomadura parmotrematis]MBW8481961.1 hypothetical protein [Actinomadura parmotrematis]